MLFGNVLPLPSKQNYRKNIFKDGGIFQNGDCQFSSCSIRAIFQPILFCECFWKRFAIAFQPKSSKKYFFNIGGYFQKQLENCNFGHHFENIRQLNKYFLETLVGIQWRNVSKKHSNNQIG
jgi:hypothetical protein